MIILLKLFVAHLVGDFLLQPKSWVEDKEKKKIKSTKLYLHVLLQGVLLLLFLWNWNLWGLVVTITLLHGLIDILKLYAQDENNKTKWFFRDQLLHLISILSVYYLWFRPPLHLGNLLQSPLVWVYLTAILFLSVVTGIIIQMSMANWSKQISDGEDKSLNNAGKYIGILERLFVFILIITAHWEAIGFLLAAKSVFRFGDLRETKNRKLTEYILIGTLLSFGIAIITGILVVQITSRYK